MSKRRAHRAPSVRIVPTLGPGYSVNTFRRAIAESVAAPPRERQTVREASVGEARATKPGRLLVRLIKAGVSMNGNAYPAAVLQDAARRKVWGRGTHCMADHAPESEERDYPAGTVKNLAGMLAEDARWDEPTQSLVAEVRLFAPWREAIADMAEAKAIGMSIRAWVSGAPGSYENQEAWVVDRIEEGRSVDFVTVPAAGGEIISVLESVGHRVPTAEARNCGHWMEARIHSGFTEMADRMFGEGYLTRPERITLSSAVGDALTAFAARIEADAPHLYQRDPYSAPDAHTEPMGAEEAARRAATEATAEEIRTALTAAIRATRGEDYYAWVRDFDPDEGLVYFVTSDDSDVDVTWRQGYEMADDGTASLTGEPTRVRARTVYEPMPDHEPGDDMPDEPMGSAESAPTTPQTAAAVTENVTDGATPTAPNPPTEEEPEMSGTQTGAPPVEAGTAAVADTPPVATTQSTARPDAQVTAALESVTAQLAEMQRQLAEQTRRNEERDADARRARNEAAARAAVTTALASADADVRDAIAPRVTESVLRNVPTTTDGGEVDTARLSEAITAAITAETGFVNRIRAEEAERHGWGMPRGLGGQPAAEADDGFEAELEEFFSNTLGLSEQAAKVAARGRV